MHGHEVPVVEDLRESLRRLWRQLGADRTISIGKLGMLSHLAARGPATSAVLATVQNVSPQAIATAVREMESLGLVERTPDEEDRRRIWISLTEAGLERLRTERASGNDWLERMMDERLDDDERALLISAVPLLRKLTRFEE